MLCIAFGSVSAQLLYGLLSYALINLYEDSHKYAVGISYLRISNGT